MKVLGREVGVFHRLLDPLVPEDLLELFQPAAVLEIPGRERVPEIVRAISAETAVTASRLPSSV